MNELLPYEDFRETETIKYGTAATSASANKAPLFIKKELNSLYNYVKMKFSEDPFEWDARYTYEIGDIVIHNDIVYKCIAVNANNEPPSNKWEVFDTSTMDMDLKYVQIASDKYINLITRNSHKMMRSNTNSTTAIMSPKNGLVPWDDGTSSDLGKSNLRWNDVYAVNGHYSTVGTGSITATTGTVTSISGTTATYDNFIGTSSSAKYADIAEKYTTDTKYTPGTVLGFGGDKELTVFKTGMKLAGVISTEPGYMLNSESEGQYIALKGRVPCKIKGHASKGDYIIATNNGYGISVQDYSFEESKILLGIAISDSKDGVVEIKV